MDEGKTGRARPEPRPPLRIGNPSRRAIRPTNMNPRAFSLLLAAVVFIVVRSVL
jgi:hypothetical protein